MFDLFREKRWEVPGFEEAPQEQRPALIYTPVDGAMLLAWEREDARSRRAQNERARRLREMAELPPTASQEEFEAAVKTLPPDKLEAIRELTHEIKIEDFEHHIQLICSAVVRLVNIGARGQAVPWDEQELAALGLTRRAVLLRLGSGFGALQNLRELAQTIATGIDDAEGNDSEPTSDASSSGVMVPTAT